MTVEAIVPHGFCLGVVQAVRRAEEALAEGPLFCLHPPIHNENVCEALAAKGLRQVASLAEIPAGGKRIGVLANLDLSILYKEQPELSSLLPLAPAKLDLNSFVRTMWFTVF